MTTEQLPRTIKASIHQDAINRVPGFFNATTADILNELLQNARRSGAARVEITTEHDRITVADNGRGIPDPGAILAFGQTDWDEKTAREEYPAGMGMYALARSEEVTVRSKTRNGAAWQVSLTPEHFVGKTAAPVERIQDDDVPEGTAVTFQKGDFQERDIRETTKYYPLPVSLNGEKTDQQDFLRNAVHTEEWQGIKIGVYTSGWTDRLNFHGIIVGRPGLPEIQAMESAWTAKADVLECPQLELTLPARKEMVETPFTDEMRTACRRAIYRAMTLQGEPVDVPKRVQEEAAKLGIKLPDAKPWLEPWTPEKADIDWRRPTGKRKQMTDPGVTIVMDADLSPGDQQTLARAARTNNIMDRLMYADDRLAGYAWYDQLPKLKNVVITITTNGQDQDIARKRSERTIFEEQRPGQITFELEVAGSEGKRELIQLSSDLAFENEANDYCEDIRPLVTRDSRISVPELQKMMTDSYFYPSDDAEADSYETQQDHHNETFENIAVELLSSKEDALRNVITQAVKRHILYALPEGAAATIRVKRGEPVRITMENEEDGE